VVLQVEACTRRVNGGEEWALTPGITIRALDTRGHTDGHMSYTATPSMSGGHRADGAVFTGDSLFIGGCGRVLEGTAEQMWVTLSETLGGLPGGTKVYPGHEYTVKNYEFAITQVALMLSLFFWFCVAFKLQHVHYSI
jgi:glyoxylase-like metal-dependent hydrolase (beta-lactamase superfamily II)